MLYFKINWKSAISLKRYQPAILATLSAACSEAGKTGKYLHLKLSSDLHKHSTASTTRTQTFRVKHRPGKQRAPELLPGIQKVKENHLSPGGGGARL